MVVIMISRVMVLRFGFVFSRLLVFLLGSKEYGGTLSRYSLSLTLHFGKLTLYCSRKMSINQ